jgi:hypothetical protein
MHVPEHVAELASPGSMNNPEVRKGILAHILWHLRVYKTTSPDLAAMMKFPPIQAIAGAAQQAQPKPKDEMAGGELEAGKLTERASDSGIGLPKPARPPEPQLQ